MMLCRARVPNQWHHREHDGLTGPDHPCPNRAKRDGYCCRHHPENLHVTLIARQAKLKTALAEVESKLANLPPANEPEIHSPS